MSYDLIFIDDEFGTITEFSGIVTDEELIQCTRERYASEHRNRNYRYILNDYTDVTTLDISADAVVAVANMAIDVSEINKNIVITGVMPTDLEFGLGRMWQAYAEKTGWRSRAFRSRAEAEQWIQEELGQDLEFNR